MDAADVLAARFEEAAAGARSLEDAFAAITAEVGGSASLMFSLVEGRPGVVGDPVAAEMQRVYQQKNWKSNDVLTARVRALTPDIVLFAQDFLPTQLIEASPFFQDYLAGSNIMWGAGWVFDFDGERWAFAIGRSRAQGPFLPEDRDLLAAAAPRITRALVRMNHASNAHARGVRDALDLRDRAYVAFDHFGLVSHVSPRAAATFDEAFGLFDQRLRASDPDANERLQALASAARCGSAGAANAGLPPLEEFLIARAPGKAPVVATPLRLRAAPHDALPGHQIVVRLADLDAHPTPRAEPLRSLFKLTAREIEIAQRIAVGDEPAGIAEALALKPSYVRQVVKSIMAKTGRRRLGQLVALLARFPDQH